MKCQLIKTLYLGLFCVLNSLNIQAQQVKYALVIGVKSYVHVQPLRNSLNDAQDIAATLKSKGFTVVEVYEPKTKREMQDGIKKYFALINDKPNVAGFVYYSGHGMQVKGANYLIPTQADLQLEADLDDQCVNMDYVMRAIEQAGNELNIFVLDACRNNPFRSFSRSGEKGLSMVDTPKGSYIVYATKPGSVASDGTGRNGLFTSRLLHYLNAEGLNIEQVFKQVARDVATASGDAQRPWIASDYTGDFYFTPSTSSTSKQPIARPDVKSEPVYRATPISFPSVDFGYGLSKTSSVKVGNQEWITKNLNVQRFANGDLIPQANTVKEWESAGKNKQPAWCYYKNDPANGPTYGKLYNWYAVNDPRGLAPHGWHIPTDSEWTTLTTYLGETTAGFKLKSATGWSENGNGNNNSNMAGLPGGTCYTDGSFTMLGLIGYWWSSSEFNAGNAWARYVGYFNEKVSRSNDVKSSGFSVRCIRD